MYDWEDDRDNGIKIRADRMMGQETDIGDEITNSIAADGQTVLVTPIPWGNQRITLLAAGTSATDAVNVSQLQGGANSYASASGTNAYVIGSNPLVTSTTLVDGLTFRVFFTNPNTNAATATLQIDGTAARNLVLDSGANIGPGAIKANSMAQITAKGSVYYFLPYVSSAVFGLQTGTTMNTTGSIAANTLNFVDCTSTIVTVKFPGTMSTGETFGIVKFGAFPMILNGSGNNINGLSIPLAVQQEQTFFSTYSGASRGIV